MAAIATTAVSRLDLPDIEALVSEKNPNAGGTHSILIGARKYTIDFPSKGPITVTRSESSFWTALMDLFDGCINESGKLKSRLEDLRHHYLGLSELVTLYRNANRSALEAHLRKIGSTTSVNLLEAGSTSQMSAPQRLFDSMGQPVYRYGYQIPHTPVA